MAVLAPSSQNTCDHNGPFAESDPSDLSVGIAESIVAPNGGFLAWGLRLIVDLSTQVNAISITRPFYRSLQLSQINSRFSCSSFPLE